MNNLLPKALCRGALLASSALWAVPALAGDTVLFAPVPGWVEQADLEAEIAAPNAPAALLRDWQYRLEDGVVTSYADTAMRMENPQALMQMGTLSLDWLPDKGDITIHRLEIHRGADVIDLVAQGVTFDVIRREQGLEQRLLDGVLTATVAVPGLREGDVLRLAYSITTDDQALGDEVQEAQFLPSAPWNVGLARAIISWPVDEEMYWRSEDRAAIAPPEERDGYRWLRVDLPLSQRPPVPEDAPFRYKRPEVLRVGSFASWEELSATMAPHFEAAAAVSADSPVAAEARRIMAAASDPRERAALAVQLVQDEVSYLLNGLDGGNYLPQTAEQTWDARYGDCKAKSVLLTALLRQMGIEAEVVLVTTEGGDAVPELLPLPLTFNHAIVHAMIDGQDYWLDGTSAATRLANLADVPPFHWALPLRTGGTGLLAMTQRDPAIPQMAVEMTLDHSAGGDFPVLFDVELQVTGPAGAQLRPLADAARPEQIREFAAGFVNNGALAGARIASAEVSYDADLALATVHLTGVADSMFEWRDGRMEVDVEQGADGSGFNPDRARPGWRDIPVATPGPYRQRFTTRLILPDDGQGYSLEGDAVMSGGYGNLHVERQAVLEDGALFAVSDTVARLGEIAPADLNVAKREARRLEGSTLALRTPEEVTWRWELSPNERERRATAILAAYDDAIAFAARDDFGPRQARAVFLESMFMFDAALADYDVLARDDPSPWTFHRRAAVLDALGRTEEAIADMRAAYEIDPQNGTAFALARMLAYHGQTAEAEELLGYLPVGEDDELTMTDVTATVMGLSGDVDAGQSVIGSLAAARAASGDALNSDCWYRGLFNVALDDAIDLCTRAVERSEVAAAPLDSRALVRFRLGMLQEAIADLDAALELAPALAPSIYLRGVVRLTAGDRGGQEDIATALAMSPQLERFYARHGIVPPR